MESALLSIEQPLRLGVYIGILSLMGLAEALWPKRHRALPRLGRWTNNLGIAALNSALLGLIFPILAVGLAAQQWQAGGGLLAQLDLAFWPAAIIAFLFLDLMIWAQHLVFHKVPILWRLHRPHHADLDLDVTSGVRFHPLEVILSMAFKLALIWLLGPPPEAVLVFEIVLNAGAVFNHANVALPKPLDRALRGLIVTPDMHRVHHSTLRHETDSNYGFNLSIWDRLFHTYRDQPEAGHNAMTIGLDDKRAPMETMGLKFLSHPFGSDHQ
ncbi:MAG: sterol desaturase family protein [Alphaproteobacteria bacterium]